MIASIACLLALYAPIPAIETLFDGSFRFVSPILSVHLIIISSFPLISCCLDGLLFVDRDDLKSESERDHKPSCDRNGVDDSSLALSNEGKEFLGEENVSREIDLDLSLKLSDGLDFNRSRKKDPSVVDDCGESLVLISQHPLNV